MLLFKKPETMKHQSDNFLQAVLLLNNPLLWDKKYQATQSSETNVSQNNFAQALRLKT